MERHTVDVGKGGANRIRLGVGWLDIVLESSKGSNRRMLFKTAYPSPPLPNFQASIKRHAVAVKKGVKNKYGIG